MTNTTCKHCGDPIVWGRQGDGKWFPVEPGTDSRHRCQLPQTCNQCGRDFKGGPWMKKCPECFTNKPASGANSEKPADARAPEPLRESNDDEPDYPF